MRIVPHKSNCVAHGCLKERSSKDRFCPKHRKRYEREKDPVRYTYNVRKMNAKRRGKSFTLTLEEFRKFCDDNPDYMKNKGRHAHCASIDRVLNSEGYHADNIEVKTVSENSKKRHAEDYGTHDDLPF